MLVAAQEVFFGASASRGRTRGDEGTLTIATTHTQARYTLPAIIAKFKSEFPGVRLSPQQASPKNLPAMLLEGGTRSAILHEVILPGSAPNIVTGLAAR